MLPTTRSASVRLGGLAVMLAGVLVAATSPALACVVGTGTATSCTEAALDTCLPGGGSFDGTVTFACGGTATITVTGTKTISADTTIDGGGVITIGGGGTVGVFSVNSGVTFTVANLIITNGHVAIGNGGAINNSGTLNVTNSTFSGNSVGSGGAGAIFNNVSATLTVTNSIFSGNSPGYEGGAIVNSGTLTVTNSTFSGNSAGLLSGGGAIVSDGTLTVTNSTFSGNNAGSFGGGGGAIANGGTLTVINSTFSGNNAGNDNPSSGAILGTATLVNSILANSIPGGNCSGGAIVDGGYNIDDGNTCGFTGTGCTNATGTSFCNTNPLLDPAGLANNGGPTETIALCTGTDAPTAGCTGASPAIDRIPVAQCPTTDQRGSLRPDDAESTCDIGAYESGTAASCFTGCWAGTYTGGLTGSWFLNVDASIITITLNGAALGTFTASETVDCTTGAITIGVISGGVTFTGTLAGNCASGSWSSSGFTGTWSGCQTSCPLCGDGILGPGEQCDPPGQQGVCPVGDVCSADCQSCVTPPAVVFFPPAGLDTFNTSGVVTVEIPALSVTESINVFGPTAIQRGDPVDPEDGRRKITTQMTTLNLTGTSPTIGPLTITQSSVQPSMGQIKAQNAGADFPADSSFDIFFEIATTLPPPLNLLHNTVPLHMGNVINSIPPLGGIYLPAYTQLIPLFDAQGNQVASLIHAQHEVKSPFCGNGIVEAWEECDDGNTIDCDGCDHNCTQTGCGNRIICPPEQCDPPGMGNGCAVGLVCSADCGTLMTTTSTTKPSTSSSTTTTTPPSVEIIGGNTTWIYNPRSVDAGRNPPITLTAVGSPPGGSYAWKIAAGRANIEPLAISPDGTQATVIGRQASSCSGRGDVADVAVEVMYTLGGQTVPAVQKITIQRAASICSRAAAQTTQGGSCGSDAGIPAYTTIYEYGILDQCGQRLDPALSGAPTQTVSEKVTYQHDNHPFLCPVGLNPKLIAVPADTAAFDDCLALSSLFTCNPPPADIRITATQAIEVSGWHVADRRFIYNSTRAFSLPVGKACR